MMGLAGNRVPSNPAPAGVALRLYVAGNAPNSVLAQANLRSLLAGLGGLPCEVEVVDCLREPQRALQDGVLVTPTLVRLAPEPRLFIVGTLNDGRRVALALELPVAAAPEVAFSNQAPADGRVSEASGDD